MTSSSKYDKKGSSSLFKQLKKYLQENGSKLVSKVKGLIVFKIDDVAWSLDLRSGEGELIKGEIQGDKPDLILTISDENFVKMVMGKLSSQTAFLLGKLKITGSMAMAMKLEPVLKAAKPQSKL
eukprot:TRINITY_DN15573_c0_g1_i1.p3 TRINITY_DN15573_c0_g1~~TRINITY_DN15573_c0_g1_i1.p3  ORF type:complete len:124 (-),score=19.32 TRINITY_DN15573_c0_g1_i1:298-669(-)